MAPITAEQALNRHALVMTVWLSAGLVAATVFHYGLGPGGVPFLLAAFGVVLCGFVGHIVVNVVSGVAFTSRELALGLVLYAVALVAFVFATLVVPGFGSRAFLPGSAGFVLVFVVVVFYLVTTAGVRGAFDAFDVVRSFKASPDRAPTAPAEVRE